VAAVSGKSRAAREERFAKEQADHRAEQEKRAKEEAQARAWILALVALAAVAAAIFGFWQKGQAEKNESKLAASKAGQSELLYIIERERRGRSEKTWPEYLDLRHQQKSPRILQRPSAG
jgi:uncharacterized protein HemX